MSLYPRSPTLTPSCSSTQIPQGNFCNKLNSLKESFANLAELNIFFHELSSKIVKIFIDVVLSSHEGRLANENAVLRKWTNQHSRSPVPMRGIITLQGLKMSITKCANPTRSVYAKSSVNFGFFHGLDFEQSSPIPAWAAGYVIQKPAHANWGNLTRSQKSPRKKSENYDKEGSRRTGYEILLFFENAKKADVSTQKFKDRATMAAATARNY